MAIDNNSLCYLFDSIFQVENVAGRPVVGGHIEVFIAGTDQKYITWQNWDGTRHPFKIPLGSDGRATILVEVQYTYDCYLYDSFGNLVCSRLNVKPAIGGDVTVYGLTEVWHDGTMSGEGTPQSPLSVVSAGKVYDGIEPIVVNNIENKISANHIPLGVQEPLYFVQDDEEACIIGCSAQTEIPAELSGKWDEASDAVIANSAQWSENTTYEAGSYIDINNNTISVTGLSPLPADTASTGLVAQVSADITAMIPDTSDMATQTWVNEQGFLTAHQDISNKLDTTAFSTVSGDFLTAIPDNYATKNYVSDSITGKLDSTAFSTVSGNFLTAVPEGYATENWVTSQGYLTAHQSLDGLMSANLLEISDNKITGYNGTAFAGQGGGVTGDYELSAGSGISIVDYPLEQKTVISVTAQGGNPEVEQAVIDNSATWDTVTAKQDSLTFGYHDTAISSIDESAIYDNSAHARINTLAGRISDLSSNKLDTTAFSDVSGTFLTAHQDLSDYQMTAGMTAYQEITGMTAYQPVGSYLTADALDSVSGDWNQVSAKLDTTAFSDVSGTFLTAHQDISNKLDTTAFSDVSGNFLTAVPDTYLQNTDLTTEDGKITAISGIPLSAGGDVPEGVMVESGLEYNAVNEISGYNGSAIAQYGAEKQWLVHDDTLVHASNSAQYALGVNLSAVAQLLGVDETVLFSGTEPTSSVSLSETWKNFDRLKIYVQNKSMDNGLNMVEVRPLERDGHTPYYNIIAGFSYGLGTNGMIWQNIIGIATDTTLTNQSAFGFQNSWTATAPAVRKNNTNDLNCILKVVGIGRKS